jgi:hypothetical protein
LRTFGSCSSHLVRPCDISARRPCTYPYPTHIAHAGSEIIVVILNSLEDSCLQWPSQMLWTLADRAVPSYEALSWYRPGNNAVTWVQIAPFHSKISCKSESFTARAGRRRGLNEESQYAAMEFHFLADPSFARASTEYFDFLLVLMK